MSSLLKGVVRDLRELRRTFKRHAKEAQKTYYKKHPSKKYSIKSETLKKRLRKSFRANLVKKTTIGGALLQPINMTITYPGNNVVNGKIMFKASVSTPPKITITPESQYLVIMSDPDAPMGAFIHMVAVYNQGKLTPHVPYYPPSPPSGTHRYQFRLFDFTGKSLSNLPRFTDNVSYSNIIMDYVKSNGLKQLGGIQQFMVKAG